MSPNTVCRVCLVDNLRLYGVRNDLKTAYERLTREMYNKDGYPLSMCYICLSVLRKCHRFTKTAQNTNRLLEQWYNQQNKIVGTPLIAFSVTKMELISLGNEDVCLDSDIKMELMDLEEVPLDDNQTFNIEITEVKSELDVLRLETNDDNKMQDSDTSIAADVYEDNSDVKLPKTDVSKPVLNHKSCTSAVSLAQHIDNKQTKKKSKKKIQRFICDTCSFKCSKRQLFVNHLKKHTDIKNKIKKHFKRSSKSKIIEHERTHTGEKPFSCHLCVFSCETRRNMTQHLRTHTGEKRFLCELCSYKCSRKNHLTRHMTTHTCEKPISCSICDFKCSLKEHLTKHMKKHTGEKLHSCSVCNSKFTFSTGLKVHMRIHTGEKPFSCDVCGYKCSAKYNLITHMRTHTGEKPYSCHICEKKFTFAHSLKDHLSKHSGKFFLCDICDFKCVGRTNLKQHVRRRHKSDKNK